MLAAVRSAGATQPVMLGGLGYASDLSQWIAHMPADPLQPAQLIASVHSYCGPPGANTSDCMTIYLPQMRQSGCQT